MPLGNIYYYFKTKADFALAVADVFVAETDSISAKSRPRNMSRGGACGACRPAFAQPKEPVAHGCPIALCIRDFRLEAPAASDRAAEAFNLLIGFMGRELGRTGLRPARALLLARDAVAEWQGGMMLAHALKDATVLSESFRRMEQLLLGQARTDHIW